jgi:hypothetical protein
MEYGTPAIIIPRCNIGNIIDIAVDSCPPWTEAALVNTISTFPIRDPFNHRRLVLSYNVFICAAILPNLWVNQK